MLLDQRIYYVCKNIDIFELFIQKSFFHLATKIGLIIIFCWIFELINNFLFQLLFICSVLFLFFEKLNNLIRIVFNIFCSCFQKSNCLVEHLFWSLENHLWHFTVSSSWYVLGFHHLNLLQPIGKPRFL